MAHPFCRRCFEQEAVRRCRIVPRESDGRRRRFVGPSTEFPSCSSRGQQAKTRASGAETSHVVRRSSSPSPERPLLRTHPFRHRRGGRAGSPSQGPHTHGLPCATHLPRLWDGGQSRTRHRGSGRIRLPETLVVRRPVVHPPPCPRPVHAHSCPVLQELGRLFAVKSGPQKNALALQLRSLTEVPERSSAEPRSLVRAGTAARRNRDEHDMHSQKIVPLLIRPFLGTARRSPSTFKEAIDLMQGWCNSPSLNQLAAWPVRRTEACHEAQRDRYRDRC
jgi:hypothetical protein